MELRTVPNSLTHLLIKQYMIMYGYAPILLQTRLYKRKEALSPQLFNVVIKLGLIRMQMALNVQAKD